MVGIDRIVAMAQRLGTTPHPERALSRWVVRDHPWRWPSRCHHRRRRHLLQTPPHRQGPRRKRRHRVLPQGRSPRRRERLGHLRAARHASSPVTRGTGRNAARGWAAEKAAGKTGTSDGIETRGSRDTPRRWRAWCGAGGTRTRVSRTGATVAAPLCEIHAGSVGGGFEGDGVGSERRGRRGQRRARRLAKGRRTRRKVQVF